MSWCPMVYIVISPTPCKCNYVGLSQMVTGKILKSMGQLWAVQYLWLMLILAF